MEIRVDKATPEQMAAAEAKLANKPRGAVDLDTDARAARTDLVQRRSDGRAAFMAALDAGELADGSAPEAPDAPEPKKPAPKPAPKKPAPVAAAADVDELEDDLEPEPELDDLDDEVADELETQPDDDTKRRLAAIKNNEKRSREGLERERAEIAKMRTEFEADRKQMHAELESFRAAKARAKFDPWSVLSAAGLSDDDAEAAAKDIYSRTKAAAADPKNREAVARMQRERQADDRVSTLEKKLETTLAELKTEREQGQMQRTLEQFFDKAIKTADETVSPLLARRLAKNPIAARHELAELAFELSKHPKLQGKPFTEKLLLKQYEKRQRAKLEELGVDVDALVAHKAAATPDSKKKPAASAAITKDQPLAAGKDRPAPTPAPARMGIRGQTERRNRTLRLFDEEDAQRVATS